MPLDSFVWFRGLEFACTCVDDSEWGQILRKFASLMGGGGGGGGGGGKFSLEQEPKVVLVDVLNAVKLY